MTGTKQPIQRLRWADLSSPKMEGAKLEEHYRETLRVLGQKGGMLGSSSERPRTRFKTQPTAPAHRGAD